MQTNTVSKHHIIQDHEFILHHCELCDRKSKQILIQRIIFMSMTPFITIVKFVTGESKQKLIQSIIFEIISILHHVNFVTKIQTNADLKASVLRS